MRVTRGATGRKKTKKLLKLAKGYRGKRSTCVRAANQAVMKAGMNAYRDRRRRKRDFRRLWITRLNAALKEKGVMYSRFIRQMEDKDCQLNRKVLSELAINDPAVFGKVVDAVMG